MNVEEMRSHDAQDLLQEELSSGLQMYHHSSFL